MKDNHVRVIGCGWFAKARALSAGSRMGRPLHCRLRRAVAGIAAAACGIAALGSAAPPPGQGMRVGLAATDITPPLGLPMAGYYHARGAEGVLDPLFSKAMVLELDGRRAAFVVVDLISVTRAVTDRARAAIHQATGIPDDHVMISATHAHTGPELAGRSRRSDDLGAQQPGTVEYTERLPGLIAASVRLACQRLEPARLSVAKGRCEDLAFNRRYFMRDGRTAWNPGKLNPDIVLPAGPADPEVGVLCVESAEGGGRGRTLATYVNFAMHPDTTGGSQFSADWPGALSRVLAGCHGSNHLTLLANGACGNVNHVDPSWAWPQKGPGEAHRIGVLLGAAVFQTCKHLAPVTPGPLRARSEIVEVEAPPLAPGEVEEARNTVAALKDDRGGNFMKLVRAYRVLAIADRQGRPHQLEVQAVALGPELAWVGLPGELFVELGLAIKKNSPFTHTFVVELANDNVGYLPDRRSYAEGAYEPESSRCAPGSGEQLANAAIQLLKQLHRENGGPAPPPQ